MVKKKGKRESRDWPNHQFEMNDKSLEKKFLQLFEEIKIRGLIK